MESSGETLWLTKQNQSITAKESSDEDKEEQSKYLWLFSQMKGISDSMAAVGAPMSDCDFMMSVLGGIGSESNHVTVLTTRKWQGMDLSNSLSMLMTHEGILEQ